MFKAPFSFEGRITRSEYLATGIIFFLLYAVGLGLIMSDSAATALGVIIIIPAIWIMLAQGWKRSHDAGWHGAVSIIPYAGFVLLFVSGDKGTNEYGPNPRLNGSQPPPQPSQATYTPPPLPSAWERARQEEQPKIRTISFKCGACGAQNANVEYQGTACCQFCGAPKE
jgi:uncharacterized membrane protein YhaH (DUF805 family)